MSLDYTVRARIVDIREDHPQAGDAFLTDTNALIWIAYTRASLGDRPPKSYQARDYPRYLELATRAGATLYYCSLSFLELAQHIERTEYRIFTKHHPRVCAKAFRHHRPTAREQVLAEIKAAWQTIEAVGTALPIRCDTASTDDALRRMHHYPLGSYDLFLVEAMRQADVTNIITDDADFAALPELTMFTSNLSILDSAARQGRLWRRPVQLHPPLTGSLSA